MTARGVQAPGAQATRAGGAGAGATGADVTGAGAAFAGGGVIVAGIGFRAGAPLAALRAALDLAVAQAGCAPQMLATAPAKAAQPQAQSLARGLDLPLRAVDVAGMDTPTTSPQVMARFATGSVAEAAALAAAGPGARLLAGRVTSACGQATAAIAVGEVSG